MDRVQTGLISQKLGEYTFETRFSKLKSLKIVQSSKRMKSKVKKLETLF